MIMAQNERTPKHAQQHENEPETASQAADLSREIIETARKEVAAVRQDTLHPQPNLRDDPPVADRFKGLPMRELIAGPLLAAAEAQEKLASVAWDYYQKIGFREDKDGKPTAETRTLDFTLERPIEQGGEMKTFTQKVSAPFIGLMPVPSLLIDRVDVDFQMEVTDTNTSKSSTTADVETKISAKWWTVTAELSGKVSTSRENTRTTNQTAKYQVHVTASQQKPTEGLSRLMDIMASCIEPVQVAAK
jgi:hypothetical protein